VNFVYAGQTSAGVAEARSYDWALWMVAGLVVLGFIANLMVKRMVDSSQPVAVATSLSHAHFHGGDGGHSRVWVVMAWLLVLGPLGWGVSMTLVKATRLLNLW
jgi:hypothetical protein